ncbi:hypothetical protein LTR72_012448, partial [Exophiala xenobiotica]
NFTLDSIDFFGQSDDQDKGLGSLSTAESDCEWGAGGDVTSIISNEEVLSYINGARDRNPFEGLGWVYFDIDGFVTYSESSEEYLAYLASDWKQETSDDESSSKSSEFWSDSESDADTHDEDS